MIAKLLEFFPKQTHSLILVSDPDNLFADEAFHAALAERHFRILQEPNPIRLRHAYSQAQPITVERPLIVVTPQPLNQLPYDLWQQGHHVELALHRFFPNLDYPTIRQLSPAQRSRLGNIYTAQPVAQPLTPRATATYLLHHLFSCDQAALQAPASLVLWLADYHAAGDPMPAALQQILSQQLATSPLFQDWPVADLLTNGDAFTKFVRQAWQGYLTQLAGEPVTEPASCLLSFADNSALQDALPRLLRLGVVQSATVNRLIETPAWANPAIAYDATAAQTTTLEEGLQALGEWLGKPELRWIDWQAIAKRWAEVTLYYYTGPQLAPDSPLHHQVQAQQSAINQIFLAWLHQFYSPLAGQRLPTPHHLFHLPGYLASQLTAHNRVALLVFDGMSLAVWQQIKATWQFRRREWHFDELQVLAQVPSITAISRQALISGLPPSRFLESLTTNGREAQQWAAFWQQHIPDSRAIDYVHLPSRSGQPYPPQLDQRSLRAFCLVTNVIDDMVHSATQGIADVHASLALWLNNQNTETFGSAWMEGLIERLLSAGYLVALTSDHGHVGATGMGQPREGVTVETRSKRARIYTDPQFASTVQSEYPDTILWYDDGLLPPDRRVLIPTDTNAFAPAGQQVVTHGGLTIEEMVVPLVIIRN